MKGMSLHDSLYILSLNYMYASEYQVCNTMKTFSCFLYLENRNGILGSYMP